VKHRIRRASTRTVTGAMRALPGPVVQRLVSAWAPLARYGGTSRGGAAALTSAISLLAEPPLSLRRTGRSVSLPEIARAIGRAEDEVDRWASWGLLGEPVEAVEPGQPSLWSGEAIERARLIDWLLDHGVGESELAELRDPRRLSLLAIDQALSDKATLTRAQVAGRARVDEDFVARVWRALGLPPGDPDEPLFSRRDVEGLRILAAMGAIFSEEQLLEATSVLGLAMSQVADSQVDLYRRWVTSQVSDAYGGNLNFVLRNVAMIDLMLPTAAQLLQIVHRRHVEAAVRNESVIMVEEAEGGLPGEVDMCVGFADLVGFTAASEELMPMQLGEMAGALVRHAEETLPTRGARIVKTIGDAVMFTATDPVAASAAALDLVERAGRDGSLPPLRAGLAHGPVLRRYGDCFGRTVNIASRLCGVAPPGAVLLHAPASVDEAAWRAAGVALGAATTLRAKGIEGGLQAVPVLRA
jgi:adenylate cyclase